MRFKKTLFMNVVLNLLVFLLAAVPASLQAQTEVQSLDNKSGGTPAVAFKAREHDFGTVPPDSPLTHEFLFTNAGSAALLIKNVKAG